MKQKKPIKVTLSIARKLVKQELGLSTAALKKTEMGPDACEFQMQQGNMLIQVENDWFNLSGRIQLTVHYSMSSIITYFFPDTLLEDSKMMLDKERENQDEIFKSWVFENGPEQCYKKIDKIWNAASTSNKA